MQINRTTEPQLTVEVGVVRHGQCVRFVHPFHQDCKCNDRYIVNDVTPGYRPFRGDSDQKIGVSNLSTGKLSYVEGYRKVVILEDAVVETNET